MNAENNHTQLAVIGGGPGGYAAAFYAADLGLKTTLIDPEPNPGGVCLFRGCIPSKALLHMAAVIDEARELANRGVTFGEPKLEVEKIRAFKNDVVERLTGGLGQLARKRRIRHLRGVARFDGPHALTVRLDSGEEKSLRFAHAIIATGSRPMRLPGISGAVEGLVDSSGALDLPDIPEHLLVVGGGYIGLEMGSVYAALGSRITVLEMAPGILPGVDRDLVRPLEKRLKKRFDAIRVETRVTDIQRSGDHLQVTVEGKAGREELAADRVLVAIGRTPFTEGLGLRNAGVERGERGFIRVDEQRRTSQPHIFAIGDVAGQPMLAHKASHEGRTAVAALLGRDVVFAPRAIPAVVFTQPEVAWCGLTEEEAQARNLPFKTARFPWSASGRAVTLGQPEGITKLVIDPTSERILGVGLCGPGAGELIAEGVVAVEMGATAADLSLSIHPHPTLSETLMEAAEAFEGYPTHIFRGK